MLPGNKHSRRDEAGAPHDREHRLDEAAAWMERCGMRYLRTGLSWADPFRPDALGRLDRPMEALAEIDVTVTFCFAAEHRGIARPSASPWRVEEEFAGFCAGTIRPGPQAGI